MAAAFYGATLMQILLVEDDVNFADSFIAALRDLEPSITCLLVRSKASALLALGVSPYDLMVCDLSIPSVDDALDEGVFHGMFVYRAARQVYPGLPIFVLSGHGEENIDFVTEAIAEAPKEDLFGSRAEIALTQFVRKARLDDCILRILDFNKAFVALDELEIDGMEERLSSSERRLLRIFARRHNGAIIKVSPLGGGLSSSKTLRVAVQDSALSKTASAVAKLSSFSAVDDEINRYRKYVAPLLGPGSFTAYSGEVRAGTGMVAGVFYTLADGYRRSLFDVLRESEADAVKVLDRLVELRRPWTDAAVSARTRVEDIRKVLIDHARFEAESELLRRHVAIDQVERATLMVRRCPSHGDLHGLNVLVSDDLRPVLIDYGDVGPWCASYDWLVVELSLLFHPAGCGIRGKWPSPDTAAQWRNVDRYTRDCPFPTFIKRCREYAREVAAAPRELLANAYSFAVRQLKYPNTDKELLVSIAASAGNGILES